MSDNPPSPSGVVMFDRTDGQNFGHSTFSAAGRDHINLNIHLATRGAGDHVPAAWQTADGVEAPSAHRLQQAGQHPSFINRVCRRFRTRSRRRPRKNVQVLQEPDNVAPCLPQSASQNQPPPGPPLPSPSSDAVVLSDGSSVSSFDSCSPSSPMAIRLRVSGEEEVYERSLLPKGQGFPLFNPPPLDKPLKFGDFGILGQDGFETFGNLFDPKDQQEFSLSSPPQHDTRRRPKKLQEGQVIASGIDDARRSSGGDQKNTDRFEFRCRETQGAALAITSNGELESLTPKSKNQLREYLCNHGTHLIRTLRRKHFLEPNQSLYVVTGTIKSESWAIAVHTSSMREPYDQMVLTKREDQSRTDLPTHEWTSWGSADARCGASDDLGEDGRRAKDQCLFLRGFLLTPSPDLEQRSPLDTDDYSNVGGSGSDSSHSKDTENARRKGDRSNKTQNGGHNSEHKTATVGSSLQHQLRGHLETPGLVQPFPTMLPSNSKHYYPSRCLNESLLKDNNLDFAITHDDDWRHKILDGYLDDDALSAFITQFWQTNIPVVSHRAATTLPITDRVQHCQQYERLTMQSESPERKPDELGDPIFDPCAGASPFGFLSPQGHDRDKGAGEHLREPDKGNLWGFELLSHFPEHGDNDGQENHRTTTRDWIREPPSHRGSPCKEHIRSPRGLELTRSSGSDNDPDKRRQRGEVPTISCAPPGSWRKMVMQSSEVHHWSMTQNPGQETNLTHEESITRQQGIEYSQETESERRPYTAAAHRGLSSGAREMSSGAKRRDANSKKAAAKLRIFKVASGIEGEDKDSKRARECLRLKIKCTKDARRSSDKRREYPAIYPTTSLTTGQGTRYVLSDTENLHDELSQLSDCIRHLEDILAVLKSRTSSNPHPLLTHDLTKIKCLIELHAAVEDDAGGKEPAMNPETQFSAWCDEAAPCSSSASERGGYPAVGPNGGPITGQGRFVSPETENLGAIVSQVSGRVRCMEHMLVASEPRISILPYPLRRKVKSIIDLYAAVGGNSEGKEPIGNPKTQFPVWRDEAGQRPSSEQRGYPAVGPDGVLINDQGLSVLPGTGNFYTAISQMIDCMRIQHLEDVVAFVRSKTSNDSHPLIARDLIKFRYVIDAIVKDKDKELDVNSKAQLPSGLFVAPKGGPTRSSAAAGVTRNNLCQHLFGTSSVLHYRQVRAYRYKDSYRGRGRGRDEREERKEEEGEEDESGVKRR